MSTRQAKLEPDGQASPIPLRWSSGGQVLLFLTVILLAAGVFATAATLNSNPINNEKNAIFADKWQYSVDEGPFIEVDLPHSEKLTAQSQITLKNVLPAVTVKGATVLLRTSQQHVEVSVDGALIYSSRNGESPIAAPSAAYHFVRLPADCGGQTITVVLSSPYDNYAGFMGQIYVGSKASNLFFLFHENRLRFITGFLVFSVGILLVVMFLFAKGREGAASITNLGAFFACAGYWVMVESRMLQFISPHPVALTNSSIFALTLLPVFSGLYYCSTHTKTYQRIGKYVVVAVFSASLLFAVAAAINPALPLRVLPYYMVFLVLYLILLFAAMIGESIKAGKFFSASACGILAFSTCALLELVLYLCNIKLYRQSNLLILGLLLFCGFMVVGSIQTFSRVYRAAIKVDALSALVYMDSLTGLKNRTAFLEELASIEAGGDTAVTIAMYDVNNLKTVNDTKGHLVGDALLRHCAKAIKASLRQEDKVYRIGGDEFVAILRHGEDFDGGALEPRLLAVLEKENQKNLSYTISIAYGFASFSHSTDQTLFGTQAKADEDMYARKKLQKLACAAEMEQGKD